MHISEEANRIEHILNLKSKVYENHQFFRKKE